MALTPNLNQFVSYKESNIQQIYILKEIGMSYQ